MRNPEKYRIPQPIDLCVENRDYTEIFTITHIEIAFRNRAGACKFKMSRRRIPISIEDEILGVAIVFPKTRTISTILDLVRGKPGSRL